MRYNVSNLLGVTMDNKIIVREAIEGDFDFVVNLMCEALNPYCGGDHKKHAERIFSTHISGGRDQIGFFSLLQKMLVAELNGEKAGFIHLVGKRQGTLKISPLIVEKKFRKKFGIGNALLNRAEQLAVEDDYHQIYCTVAQQNSGALNFFTSKDFVITGRSDSHYKSGITELMLYKPLIDDEDIKRFDRQHISVHPYDDKYEHQVRKLLLEKLPNTFRGINDDWVTGLFEGYKRRKLQDINAKYKLIFLARDPEEKVRGVVGATPKKGSPIKLMPFIALDLPAFMALLRDIPFLLKEYGAKLYIHLSPTPDETIALQQCGWMLNGAMPAAYHPEIVTQQWSLDIDKKKTMRSMRVKDKFLKFIESGKKDLEVRVGYNSFRKIKVGELVNFNNRNRSIIRRIADIRTYKNFEEMVNAESPSRIVPEISRENLLGLLRDIYPKHKEKLGVIVFEITEE